jgi:hypothetical protein
MQTTLSDNPPVAQQASSSKSSSSSYSYFSSLGISDLWEPSGRKSRSRRKRKIEGGSLITKGGKAHAPSL